MKIGFTEWLILVVMLWVTANACLGLWGAIAQERQDRLERKVECLVAPIRGSSGPITSPGSP